MINVARVSDARLVSAKNKARFQPRSIPNAKQKHPHLHDQCIRDRSPCQDDAIVLLSMSRVNSQELPER